MMPNILIILGVIVVVVVGVLLITKYLKTGSSVAYPFLGKPSLCSPSERSLLGVLDQVSGDKYRIFIKVRLADLIAIQRGAAKSIRQSALNRISRKHVDFVICEKTDLSILGVIELDDQSHKLARRRKRDGFLDKALNAAGIPILRIKAQHAYSAMEIQRQVQESLLLPADVTETDLPPPVTKVIKQDKTPSASEVTAPFGTCTECGAPMVKRQARKGKYAGQYFLACTNFPKCRKIVPIKKTAS